MASLKIADDMERTTGTRDGYVEELVRVRHPLDESRQHPGRHDGGKDHDVALIALKPVRGAHGQPTLYLFPPWSCAQAFQESIHLQPERSNDAKVQLVTQKESLSYPFVKKLEHCSHLDLVEGATRRTWH